MISFEMDKTNFMSNKKNIHSYSPIQKGLEFFSRGMRSSVRPKIIMCEVYKLCNWHLPDRVGGS